MFGNCLCCYIGVSVFMDLWKGIFLDCWFPEESTRHLPVLKIFRVFLLCTRFQYQFQKSQNSETLLILETCFKILILFACLINSESLQAFQFTASHYTHCFLFLFSALSKVPNSIVNSENNLQTEGTDTPNSFIFKIILHTTCTCKGAAWPSGKASGS